MYRSVRQDLSDGREQAIEEEEDIGEEEDSEPILQRVFHLRSRLRTDTGTTGAWANLGDSVTSGVFREALGHALFLKNEIL